MTVLLGGRAAEEIVFGAVTTGASNDLHRVAEISRSMIHEYAMGTSITSRKVSAHGGEVSDRTRELRDEEQQHLADEAKRAAVRLIAGHRDKLDEMAAALLRNEVLERADIDRIMAGTPRFKRAAGGLRVVAAEAPARAAGLSRLSRHDERVGGALDRDALQAAVADLAVGVELGPGWEVDLDLHRRGGARRRAARRSSPRFSPHARRTSPTREPAGSIVTSRTPSCGSAAPTLEPRRTRLSTATITCHASPSKIVPVGAHGAAQRRGRRAARTAPTA